MCKTNFGDDFKRDSQFTSRDWASFLQHQNLDHSMSRRGNCHANAVAKSFFKRERIRRRTYRTRAEVRQEVFDYIEMFCNPSRKHTQNRLLSPVEYERQHEMITDGVEKPWGYSSGFDVIGSASDECD